MFVIPKSEVSIESKSGGNVIRFYGENSGINKISITRSLDNIGSTAKVVIPRNFKPLKGNSVLDYIHVGDKAFIKLGYNDKINEEFVGYVSAIGEGTPIEIELDDCYYLKRGEKPDISKETARPLKYILEKDVLPGYKIDDLVNYQFPKCVIQNKSAYEVIKNMQESVKFAILMNEDQKTATCFRPYLPPNGYKTHTYVFGTYDSNKLEALRQRNLSPNIVKNELKFSKASDLKLQVTAVSKQEDGKELKQTKGNEDSDAVKKTISLGPNLTKEQVEQEAEAELKRLSYDGYTGAITGFGYPQTQPGDLLQIVDVEHPEREGKFLIKSVEITYTLPDEKGMGGFRRKNELSYKIKEA